MIRSLTDYINVGGMLVSCISTDSMAFINHTSSMLNAYGSNPVIDKGYKEQRLPTVCAWCGITHKSDDRWCGKCGGPR